jgi:hypothetical protein
LHYLAAGMPVFLRLSEYEPETKLFDRAAGVWLDGFKGEWWSLDLVRSLSVQGRSVAIVSSELHGRDHQILWQQLKTLEGEVRAKVMLCTDFPDAAENFFAD